jgi:hypothetical protein
MFAVDHIDMHPEQSDLVGSEMVPIPWSKSEANFETDPGIDALTDIAIVECVRSATEAESVLQSLEDRRLPNVVRSDQDRIPT